MKNTQDTKKIDQAWNQLAHDFHLSDVQLQQCQKYSDLLGEWNKQYDLTAVIDPYQIIVNHFRDSLMGAHYIDQYKPHMMVDVGSGAGFPGVPLKIKYPEMSVVLIEVSGKRISFLREVIETLQLQSIELYTLDWRTFLRKTEYQADLFVARASLDPVELLRMFKPSSPYTRARLIYWASRLWESDEQTKPAIVDEFSYKLGDKQRKLVVFENPKDA